jgi:hypothetical protein
MSTGEGVELGVDETAKDTGTGSAPPASDVELAALVRAIAGLPPGFSGVIECDHDDGTCRRCHRVTIGPQYPTPAPPPAPM